jgi:ribonucleoside-diphosphate reductase alpha chain
MGLTFLEDYRRENLPKRSGREKSAPEADKDDRSSDNEDAEPGAGKEAGNPLGAAKGLYAGETAGGGNGGTRSGAQTRREGARIAQALDDQFSRFQEDAPACDNCGSITVRNGNCYKCYNCGSSLGCS